MKISLLSIIERLAKNQSKLEMISLIWDQLKLIWNIASNLRTPLLSLRIWREWWAVVHPTYSIDPLQRANRKAMNQKKKPNQLKMISQMNGAVNLSRRSDHLSQSHQNFLSIQQSSVSRSAVGGIKRSNLKINWLKKCKAERLTKIWLRWNCWKIEQTRINFTSLEWLLSLQGKSHLKRKYATLSCKIYWSSRNSN